MMKVAQGIIYDMSNDKERITAPDSQPEDRIDQALRPSSLNELIGQDQVKQNLEMIAGTSEHMSFIDLEKGDDLEDLKGKVDRLLSEFKDDPILFACDLLGASPFQVAAEICAYHPDNYWTVAGLNTMAFLELSLDSSEEMTIKEWAERAVETTKSTVAKFPE